MSVSDYGRCLDFDGVDAIVDGGLSLERWVEFMEVCPWNLCAVGIFLDPSKCSSLSGLATFLATLNSLSEDGVHPT